MPLNFDLAGKVYDPVRVTIAAEEIEQYALASGDRNPRHAAGPDQIASLVFPVRSGLGLMLRAMADPELGVENPLMIVHGEQSFTYHRPIRPGDTLTMTPRLESVEDKGRGATFTSSLAAVDEHGEPVVEQSAVIFVRGGGSGRDRPRGERAPPPEKGSVAAEFTSHVPEDMPVRYAEASGDHNPIHTDPDVAAAVGLPGVINHGLGTLSLVAGGIVAEVLDGDPTAVAGLGVRFTDMVFPGTDIATTVWEAPGGYLFETTRPDGAVVMTGDVRIRES